MTNNIYGVQVPHPSSAAAVVEAKKRKPAQVKPEHERAVERSSKAKEAKNLKADEYQEEHLGQNLDFEA